MPTRTFGDRDLELLREVIASGNLSSLGGPYTPRFEAAFAAAHEAEHAVAMNAAMSVLHASVIASGAGPGDEVLCDPICVFGSVAVMYANAVPVFVDVNPVTWNMDPDLIEAAITERTKALIVTHVCGLAAEMDRIMEIASRHGLFVIEDCAHAQMTRYKGRYVGTWGHVGSFSFQASKQMGLGDGGMGIAANSDIANQLSLHASAPTFQSVAHGLHYNYRMTELVAAVGLAQLELFPEYLRGLRWAAKQLDEAVDGCPWITIQQGPEGAEHGYHLWGATMNGEDVGITRDDFARVLEEEKCDLWLGYTNMPAYRHPVIAERLSHRRGCPLDCPHYSGIGNQYQDGLCPVAEDLFPRILMAYTFQPYDAIESLAERLHRAVGRMG